MNITACFNLTQEYWPYLMQAIAYVPKGIPVIVAQYGPGAPPKGLAPRVQVVRAQQFSQNYRRGYVLNVAVRRAETDYVLLCDAAFLFPRNFLDTVSYYVRPSQVLRFYVARLTKPATDKVLCGANWEALYSDYSGKNGTTHDLIYGANNPCVYTRSDLVNLGGYDERISGWGGEDDDLNWRGRKLGLIDFRAPVVVGCMNDNNVSRLPQYTQRKSPDTIKILQDKTRPPRANNGVWGDAQA